VGGRVAVVLAVALTVVCTASAAGQSRFTLSPYVGTLFVDGSCVYRDLLGCVGFSGPTLVKGATASYEIAPDWRIEGTYAHVSIGGAAPSALTTGPPGSSSTDRGGVPFGTVATLAHVTVRRSLARTSHSDVFATASAGRIAFDAGREDREFADLLLGAGLGFRLGEGPIGLRADARAFAQPCASETPELDGLACDDGSWLTHAEVSGGVVLTFPGIGSAAFRGQD
jgi:hypothetical protein